MAPPTTLFPLRDLEQKAQVTTSNLKEKHRKIRDFDLEKCELFELVQYSCITQEEMMRRTMIDGRPSQMVCVPFVRLFRRCGKGEKMFHVETTAWEGEHAWEPPAPEKIVKAETSAQQPQKKEDTFASYGSYFWSK